MSDDKLKRRDFMTLTGKAALMATVFGGGGYLLAQNEYTPTETAKGIYKGDRRIPVDTGFPDVVSVKSSDYAKATLAAIGLIGGIGRFISKGDIVTIKPNIGWDRTPEQGANTHPELVKAVALECLNAGAKKVIVTDISCNDPRRCFPRSGITAAMKDLGVELILPEDRMYVNIDLGGEILGEWQVLRPFVECDKLINMPVVKHHGMSKATIGMKNWFGVLGGARNKLHQQIDTSIVDLSDFFRPSLIVVDATRVMMRNGPVGGSPSDVEIHDTVIASTDQVAADSYSSKFLKLKPEDLEYLSMGEKRGLGKLSGYSLTEKELS